MRFTQAVAFGLFGAAAAQVSAVLSDLATIKSDVSGLTSSLNSYTGGVAAALPILKSSTALKVAIGKATTDANNAGTVSESDQASVLTAVEGLYPGIIESLDAYVKASSKFPSTIQGTAKQTLTSLQSSTDDLAKALSAKATGQYSSIASTITSDIDAAFQSALAGNAPQAMNLPSVPSSGSSGGSSAGSSAATSAATSAASSAATSKAAATTTKAAVTSSPAAMTATSSAPGYSGAANKVAGSVGGAVLVAAAAFAL